MTVSESAHIQPAGEAGRIGTHGDDEPARRGAAARLSRSSTGGSRGSLCGMRLAPCQSEYWWQGKLEQAQEWPLLIKTTRAQYAALEAVIRAEHPYDVLELVAWPLGAGCAPYLAWVQRRPAGKPCAATPPRRANTLKNRKSDMGSTGADIGMGWSPSAEWQIQGRRVRRNRRIAADDAVRLPDAGAHGPCRDRGGFPAAREGVPVRGETGGPADDRSPLRGG